MGKRDHDSRQHSCRTFSRREAAVRAPAMSLSGDPRSGMARVIQQKPQASAARKFQINESCDCGLSRGLFHPPYRANLMLCTCPHQQLEKSRIFGGPMRKQLVFVFPSAETLLIACRGHLDECNGQGLELGCARLRCLSMDRRNRSVRGYLQFLAIQ